MIEYNELNDRQRNEFNLILNQILHHQEHNETELQLFGYYSLKVKRVLRELGFKIHSISFNMSASLTPSIKLNWTRNEISKAKRYKTPERKTTQRTRRDMSRM